MESNATSARIEMLVQELDLAELFGDRSTELSCEVLIQA
jgi:hypothetical protein